MEQAVVVLQCTGEVAGAFARDVIVAAIQSVTSYMNGEYLLWYLLLFWFECLFT